MLRTREDTSVVHKRFGFSENKIISLSRWSRTVHGPRRQRQSTRKRWSTRPLLFEGAECKRKHGARASHSRDASKTQHPPTHQQATLHSKWHELALEDRSSRAMRAFRQTGNETMAHARPSGEGDRDCEGSTGRAIIVMTIASRWREASIENRDPSARRVEAGTSNEVARYADLDAGPRHVRKGTS